MSVLINIKPPTYILQWDLYNYVKFHASIFLMRSLQTFISPLTLQLKRTAA